MGIVCTVTPRRDLPQHLVDAYHAAVSSQMMANLIVAATPFQAYPGQPIAQFSVDQSATDEKAGAGKDVESVDYPAITRSFA